MDRVNRAEGEASRFSTVEAAYRQAPAVTRRRRYLETMQRILPSVGRKVYVAEGATGVLPLLSLDGGARTAKAPLVDSATRTGGGQGELFNHLLWSLRSSPSRWLAVRSTL